MGLIAVLIVREIRENICSQNSPFWSCQVIWVNMSVLTVSKVSGNILMKLPGLVLSDGSGIYARIDRVKGIEKIF